MAKKARAAIGFSVHTGWAVAVAVSSGKQLLFRERVELFDDPYRFAYHAAADEPWRAEQYISTAEKKARASARAFLKRACDEALEGYALQIALAPPKRELPPLAKILEAHPLLHTAEGELYRVAIAHAAEKLKLVVLTPAVKAEAPIENPGRPWSKDHRTAAALAWAALASKSR
jgi:hypothetical protein